MWTKMNIFRLMYVLKSWCIHKLDFRKKNQNAWTSQLSTLFIADFISKNVPFHERYERMRWWLSIKRPYFLQYWLQFFFNCSNKTAVVVIFQIIFLLFLLLLRETNSHFLLATAIIKRIDFVPFYKFIS